MVYDFSVLFKDELVADVHINTEKNESSIKRYLLGPKQPFMCDRQDIFYIFGLQRKIHRAFSSYGDMEYDGSGM